MSAGHSGMEAGLARLAPNAQCELVVPSQEPVCTLQGDCGDLPEKQANYRVEQMLGAAWAMFTARRSGPVHRQLQLEFEASLGARNALT